MNCPFCGEEMTTGAIIGDPRARVRWENDGEKLDFFERHFIPAEYKFFKFKINGDFCKKCGKIIIDFNEKK